MEYIYIMYSALLHRGKFMIEIYIKLCELRINRVEIAKLKKHRKNVYKKISPTKNQTNAEEFTRNAAK